MRKLMISLLFSFILLALGLISLLFSFILIALGSMASLAISVAGEIAHNFHVHRHTKQSEGGFL